MITYFLNIMFCKLSCQINGSRIFVHALFYRPFEWAIDHGEYLVTTSGPIANRWQSWDNWVHPHSQVPHPLQGQYISSSWGTWFHLSFLFNSLVHTLFKINSICLIFYWVQCSFYDSEIQEPGIQGLVTTPLN